MLHNLQAELKRRKIKHEDAAAEIEISTRTFSNKINGATAFTFPETVKIRDKFFPDMELDYLFADDDPDDPKAKAR
jgi:plasmid maintenance system antidote protein VapI